MKQTDWFNTKLGEKLIAVEEEMLHPILKQIFANNALCIAPNAYSKLNESINVPFKFEMFEYNSSEADLIARSNEIPLQTDSLDLILLIHELEFNNKQHDILREAYRVLAPEGSLIIIGFNAISLWRIWQITLKFKNNIPWSADIITNIRLKDWMQLLGFTVYKTKTDYFSPPILHPKLEKPFNCIEKFAKKYLPMCGAVNLMWAKKHLTPLTLTLDAPVSKVVAEGVVNRTY